MVYYGMLWYVMVYYGLKSLPILWFQNPCRNIVCGTSNGPQNDIGNHLGPYIIWMSRFRALERAGSWALHGLGLITITLQRDF